MSETILKQDMLHVHYWTQKGQETNVDDGNVTYLYECSTCGKVKRQ